MKMFRLWSRVLLLAVVGAAAVLLFGASAADAATTLHVDAATGQDSSTCGTTIACRTIGQAVANASGGDTIMVAVGTYDEFVVVDKSLTLEGAQSGNPGTAARAAESPTTESIVDGNIDTEASNVVIDGFAFDLPGNQVCVTCLLTGPAVASSSPSGVTIENNIFSGYAPNGFSDYSVNGAIGVNHTSDTVVEHNYFTSPNADLGDFGSATIQWFDAGCDGAAVTDNTFVSPNASALADAYFWCSSIWGQTPASISVSGNRDTITGSSDFALFTHVISGGEVDVTNNAVTMTSAGSSGIFFSSDAGLGTVRITGNRLTRSPFRAVKFTTGANVAGPITVTGNDFSDNGVGVYFGRQGLAPTSTAVLRANNLSGETGDSAGDGPDGVFRDPSSGGTIDAADNWWGCNAGPGQAGCSTAFGMTAPPSWLVLGISASPSTLVVGGSSTVTADVSRNSNGIDTTAEGTILDGTSIAFATDFGTLSASSAGTSGGKASVSLGSATPGTANVSATLDMQSISTTVTFTLPPRPTSVDQCKHDGWVAYGIFKNQGDCVSFVVTHGKNAPGK